MLRRVMERANARGGRAASTAAVYATPVSRGVTCRFSIAMRRTADTRSAICVAVKPSGKMIRSVTCCGSCAGRAAAPATSTSESAAIGRARKSTNDRR